MSDKSLLKEKGHLKKKLSGSKLYLINWIQTFRGKLTVVCLIGLFIVPLITQNRYYLGIFIIAMIFSIFAASWDFLAGFTGQVSFGHAIFFGIAGYITSYFIRYVRIMDVPFPWWASLLIGSLVGILFGLLIGIPALRLKGPYLGLGTMVLGSIMFYVFLNVKFEPWLGGTEGISQIPQISKDAVLNYYIHLIFMIISFEILIFTAKSKMGTVLKSIRDDDKGAETSGINITKYKIIAFMISAFFAGIAGGLFAMHTHGVNPGVYQPLYSFYAIVMASLGGIATISGSALGAFFFWFVAEIFSEWPEISVFIFAVILIIVIRFAEHGILKPILERLKDLWDVLLGK
jgi:branched-chain amino acid transport system permease protein